MGVGSEQVERSSSLASVASGTVPSLRDRAASDQGPGHLTVLTGSSLHGGPQRKRTDQHRTYRNLCCTVYVDFVPAWHSTDGDVALANGAGLWRCTAGVTPASTRTGTGGLRREQAPVLCTPAMARDHTLFRENAMTLPLTPTKTP